LTTEEVAMSKVRKALVAGGLAGVAALVAAIQDGKVDNADIGTIVAAVVVAGLAVWRVPNAPAVK
jgi:hypothetical protein